ncbi:O-antigen ligase family protein [Cerasicoccus fimbriatus]|uniref:O-antigen ligase family protein n=1 Tax=Cerasicoccus fimbriatus TaxID=3014554 RepID=UPI0022B32861|nr:O-antigen ligase family protein [Cerasicoccus sp. TK19100]
MGSKPKRRKYAAIHTSKGSLPDKPVGSDLAAAQPAPATPLKHFLTVIGLFALVLLSGGRYLWVEGSFVALIGLLLVACPPLVSLDKKMDWIVLGIVAVACFSFVPSGILTFLPDLFFGRASWWKEINQSGAELPVTMSTQPLKSLEALLLLIAVLSYVYLLANARFQIQDRTRLLLTFVIMGGVLAGVVVYGDSTGLQYFNTDRAASFSFFDNRNQTSILMVMIGVISLGLAYYCFAQNKIVGLICGLAFLSATLAISVSLSRAGMLLFVLGCGVWVILRFTVFGGQGAVKFVVPLVAFSFSMMLITGQQTLSRFNTWLGEENSMFEDFRWGIYRDSLAMVANQPATGVGLGNFAAVFPHYRNESLSPEPIIHPESDWMWLASEMGVLGFSLFAMLIVFMYWMLLEFGEDRLASVRTAAVVAASVFLVHTFFDVSGHQLGVVLIAIWLFRMGFPYLLKSPSCLIPVWVWRGVGVVLVLSGSVWITADLTGLMLHSSVVKRELPDRVTAAMEAGSSAEIGEDIETGLTFLPMDWELYLQRGQYNLYLQNDTAAARKDFQIARTIEPNLVAPSFYEGQVWLPRSTHYAYEAWKDALTRQSQNPGELHHRIILASRQNPRFSRDLDRLSQLDPMFRTNYLLSLMPDEFLLTLSAELKRDPKLSFYTPAQRASIMNMWLERGDAGQLIRFLEANPDAAPNSWYYRASALGRMGNYPAAIELAKQFAPVPQIPAMESLTVRDVGEQRAIFASRPNDVVRGGILLQTQLNQNDTDGARWTIEQLLKMEKPPPYAYYYQGELSRLNKDYKEAWAGWKRYLEEVIERKIKLKSSEASMFEGIDDTDENPLLRELADPFQRK